MAKEPTKAAEPSSASGSTRLVIVLVLIGAFFFVELIGAKIARSDVLEADAFHLLMDVFAIAISLFAMRVASRKPTSRFTFGLRRAEPLAALTNGVLVLGVAVELVRDAIEHLGTSTMPRSGVMLIVATAALVVNGINAWLLHGAMGHGHGHHHHGHGHHGHGHSGHQHSHSEHSHSEHEHEHEHGHEEDRELALERERGRQLNLRGAWLHLLGDALGSLAAFIAGLAIRFGAPPIVDPIASFFVVAILVVGALRLLRDAGLVLLEAAPLHLPVPKIEKALLAIEGVVSVGGLHVWSLGSGHDAIVAHVRTASKDPSFGTKVADALRKRFTCEYVTVQVEIEE
jgi:cation diffusion facilitator family transporter